MIKRILAVLAAIMMLTASAALAEDLSALTDRELMKLYLDVVDEMRNRTAADREGESADDAGAIADVESEEDMVVASRLIEFFSAWHDNNYNDMIELCANEWKVKESNPKDALFTILQNRTPDSVQIETISGSSEDLTRQMNFLVLMNYNNKKESVMLRMTVVMVREEDGLWYINPESLLFFNPVYSN